VPNRGTTKRRIAEAALELVDAEGVEGLSMRKLAQSVGVAPMSLYTYFPDRDAVLEALTQLVLAEIELPEGNQGWQEELTGIMRSVRQVGLRHPNVAPLMNRYPPRTLDALAFVEAGVRTLRTAGFDDRSTARCYRALAAYSMGTFDVELGHYFGGHPAARPRTDSLSEPQTNRHMPNLARVAPALADQDDEAEFEYGLNLLLTGFAATMGVN
jgi:AcrR family transcriptional regulator